MGCMRPRHHTRPRGTAECGVTDRAEAERATARLAGKQYGVISARQLHALGFSEGAIKRRLRAGRLHRVHRGVYLVGHDVAADGALEMAALLACGHGSVVSHRSAARLWGLPPFATWRAPIELTVTARDPGKKSGIGIHRVRRLDRGDTRRIRGIPITSPARTLLDLAGVVPLEALETAFAEARARRLVRDRDVAAQLARGRGRRGAAALRRLLNQESGPALTRSEAERRLLRLVRAAALPTPEVNVKVGRSERDFLWRRERMVVEVNGYAYHSDKRAFERDRERDATLVADGYAVIRVTWRKLVSNPEAVIARIAAALAVRSADRETWAAPRGPAT